MSSNFTKKCEALTSTYKKNTTVIREDGENDPGNQAAIGLAKGAFTVGANMFQYFFLLKKFISNATKEIQNINSTYAQLYSNLSKDRATRIKQINAIPLQQRADLEDRVQALAEKITNWQKTLSQLFQTKRVRNFKAQLDIISRNLSAIQKN